MSTAFIALGGNLGQPDAQMRQALQAIGALPGTRLMATSRWYRSAPVGGPPGQPDFLNAVCRVDTRLAPRELLNALQRIEQAAGRIRLERWGPRTLDLDIILYDQLEQSDPELTLPHPRAHERAFVLRPLADLEPDLTLHGRPVSAWLSAVSDQKLNEA